MARRYSETEARPAHNDTKTHSNATGHDNVLNVTRLREGDTAHMRTSTSEEGKVTDFVKERHGETRNEHTTGQAGTGSESKAVQGSPDNKAADTKEKRTFSQAAYDTLKDKVFTKDNMLDTAKRSLYGLSDFADHVAQGLREVFQAGKGPESNNSNMMNNSDRDRRRERDETKKRLDKKEQEIKSTPTSSRRKGFDHSASYGGVMDSSAYTSRTKENSNLFYDRSGKMVMRAHKGEATGFDHEANATHFYDTRGSRVRSDNHEDKSTSLYKRDGKAAFQINDKRQTLDHEGNEVKLANEPERTTEDGKTVKQSYIDKDNNAHYFDDEGRRSHTTNSDGTIMLYDRSDDKKVSQIIDNDGNTHHFIEEKRSYTTAANGDAHYYNEEGEHTHSIDRHGQLRDTRGNIVRDQAVDTGSSRGANPLEDFLVAEETASISNNSGNGDRTNNTNARPEEMSIYEREAYRRDTSDNDSLYFDY